MLIKYIFDFSSGWFHLMDLATNDPLEALQSTLHEIRCKTTITSKSCFEEI